MHWEISKFLADDVEKHLDIEFFTVKDKNHKRCIFPILPVNVPLS